MPPQGHTSLTYLQQDNFDSAYAVMDRLPVEFKLKEKEISEKDRTKQFIGIVQGYRSGGRSETELNESDLSALRAMAADVYDRPAEWAQNIVRGPATGAQGNRWQIGTLAIWRIPSALCKTTDEHGQLCVPTSRVCRVAFGEMAIGELLT